MEKDKNYDFTHMQNIKQKSNKQDKNKLIDSDNRMVGIRGKVGWEWKNWVNGVKYMVMEGNQIFGGNTQCRDTKL